MDEKFSLKWNDFQTNVVSSFSRLRSQSNYTDVTLVSADKKQISAHQVVLATSSGFFSNILEQNTQSHLMICLDGISSAELTSVLDYIYLGEVNILQENLNIFLEVAHKLELEGLLASEIEEFEPSNDEKPFGIEPLDDHEITETESFSPKPSKILMNTRSSSIKQKIRIVMDANDFSTIEELDSQILQQIERTTEGNKCSICNYISKNFSHTKEHIESHCKGLSFACKFCGTNFNYRVSLRHHVKRCKNKIQ